MQATEYQEKFGRISGAARFEEPGKVGVSDRVQEGALKEAIALLASLAAEANES